MITKINEIEEQLEVIIREINPDIPETLLPEAHWKQDLGIDSLDLMEWVARIEQKYRIRIPDDEWKDLSSIQNIAKYVYSSLKN